MEATDERARLIQAGKRKQAGGVKPADEVREVHERVAAAVHGDCVSRARREIEQQARPARHQEIADEMFEFACKP
eukprot:11171807-Lingulodinium_polyedra.AAC.1